MIALSFRGVRDIEVCDKPEPGLRADTDVVVEVELAGLCGSDLHPYRGDEVGIDPGTTMGHEFTGRVVEAGRAVRAFRPGDAVLSPFSTSCGACAPCRRGLSSRCARGELFGWVEGGRGLEGAQTRFVRVPFADQTLLARPGTITAEEALLLGDVASTGRHVLRRALDIAGDPEGPVAVIGCGAVGLAAVMYARPAERPVVALDRHEVRLARARELGAEPICVVGDAGQLRPTADLVAELRGLVGDDGVAVAIDAVGSPLVTELAVEILRPGGTLGIAGVHNEPHFAVSPDRAYAKNLTMFIGRCPVRSSLADALDEQVRTRLPIASLITHRLALATGPGAYDAFDRGAEGMIKVVFAPGGAGGTNCP